MPVAFMNVNLTSDLDSLTPKTLVFICNTGTIEQIIWQAISVHINSNAQAQNTILALGTWGILVGQELLSFTSHPILKE